LFGEVARIASKHADVMGDSGASVAPAITTSAEFSSMSIAPCPTASRPDVQPVEISAAGPSAPASQATSTASVLGTM
jgi:hypothetical protein